MSFLPGLETALREDVIAPWIPRSIDSVHGGFHEDYDANWKEIPSTKRSLVHQARILWTASEAAILWPNELEVYLPSINQGIDQLVERHWDQQCGGFFWEVDTSGQPQRDGRKHLYGLAFAIYALSSAALATGSQLAAEFAQRGLAWLEEFSYDPVHGGYREGLSREGQPETWSGNPQVRGQRGIIGPAGFRTMNSNLHILEALVKLHKAAPSPTTRARIEENVHIFCDKMYVEPGALHSLFNRDWTSIPDHNSYGHDMEAAFLILEATEAIDLPLPHQARRLLDHSLDVGWDQEFGGFFDKGDAFGHIFDYTKVWWVQAEALNALAFFAARFPEEELYLHHLVETWNFIQERQRDQSNGGWHANLHRSGEPMSGPKSNAWIDPYHQARALINALKLDQDLVKISENS